MSEIAAIITAGTSAIVALGGGIAWLWARVEKGLGEVKDELKACQAREGESTKREAELRAQLRETSAKHLTVIELLWQEVERRSRGAPNAVLGRARKLLDALKEETTL